MSRVILYLLLLMLLPYYMLAQAQYSGRKTVSVGRTTQDIHNTGVCWGENPIFLIPKDTLGNVSFTAVLNKVKVIGQFVPAFERVDTSEIIEPVTGEYLVVYSIDIVSRKHGEWNYYYDDYSRSYREYYNKGELIKKDTINTVFKIGSRAITVTDSMARIRSIVDLYLQKGKRSD